MRQKIVEHLEPCLPIIPHANMVSEFSELFNLFYMKGNIRAENDRILCIIFRLLV